MKFHVKKGDEVVVLAGKSKGKRGKIIAVNSTKQRVIIEGVQMIKRHTAKSQQHPQGAIVEREGITRIVPTCEEVFYLASCADQCDGAHLRCDHRQPAG